MTGRERDRERGQTAIDFALGMGVFLLAVAFTFGAIPALFEPFDGDSGTRATVADRSADRLTEDLLVASPARPSVLNATCTEAFFGGGGGGGPPAGCRYDADGSNLEAALGLQEWRSVNVTVRNGSEIRTLDETDLRAGPAPAADADAVAARRVVRLAGERDRLVVRVW